MDLNHGKSTKLRLFLNFHEYSLYKKLDSDIICISTDRKLNESLILELISSEKAVFQ